MKFIHPRYWLIWILYGIVRVISYLPYNIQMYLGSLLGRLLLFVSPERKKIAKKNIELCFPEWSKEKRHQILKKHFDALGKSFFEFGIGYWVSDKRFKPLAHLEGIENLTKALQKGKGAIILAGHFTTLEIICRVLVLHTDFHPTYRKHNNPLIEHIITSNRLRYVSKVIPHDNLKSLIQSLRGNNPVLYNPDQNFGRKHSIFVPFFGIQTATVPATSRLAAMTDAPVVPIVQHRLPDNKGYRLVIMPELENFPTENIEQDTIRLNRLFEKLVRENPANYLWVHRRFKTRPDGESPIYN